LMSVAVDFGITQVVDGNWGVHAIIKKNVFAGAAT
jgi:acetamidase/formamidase